MSSRSVRTNLHWNVNICHGMKFELKPHSGKRGNIWCIYQREREREVKKLFASLLPQKAYTNVQEEEGVCSGFDHNSNNSLLSLHAFGITKASREFVVGIWGFSPNMKWGCWLMFLGLARWERKLLYLLTCCCFFGTGKKIWMLSSFCFACKMTTASTTVLRRWLRNILICNGTFTENLLLKIYQFK